MQSQTIAVEAELNPDDKYIVTIWQIMKMLMHYSALFGRGGHIASMARKPAEIQLHVEQHVNKRIPDSGGNQDEAP